VRNTYIQKERKREKEKKKDCIT